MAVDTARDQERDVQQHRFDKLTQLGVSRAAARRLLDVPDVVHEVCELVERGCPPHLAARILRPI